MTTSETKIIPKGYGSIPHLPGSRMHNREDKGLNTGQVKILTEKKRDRHDRIIIQEKLDGSCVGVIRINSNIIPITRSGFTALSSPHRQHHMFHSWAMERSDLFLKILNDGERLMGEWLAMAHGILYKIDGDPFFAFDILDGIKRLPFDAFKHRVNGSFQLPVTLSDGPVLPLDELTELIKVSHHGGEFSEGAIYRCERNGEVDFLGKYVNPVHICGKYFSETPEKLIWNWNQNKSQG